MATVRPPAAFYPSTGRDYNSEQRRLPVSGENWARKRGSAEKGTGRWDPHRSNDRTVLRRFCGPACCAGRWTRSPAASSSTHSCSPATSCGSTSTTWAPWPTCSAAPPRPTWRPTSGSARAWTAARGRCGTSVNPCVEDVYTLEGVVAGRQRFLLTTARSIPHEPEASARDRPAFERGSAQRPSLTLRAGMG